jgi:hypothetical protein
MIKVHCPQHGGYQGWWDDDKPLGGSWRFAFLLAHQQCSDLTFEDTSTGKNLVLRASKVGQMNLFG